MYQEMDEDHKKQMLYALTLTMKHIFLMMADVIEQEFKDKSIKEICEWLRNEARGSEGEQIMEVVTLMHNFMMNRQGA